MEKRKGTVFCLPLFEKKSKKVLLVVNAWLVKQLLSAPPAQPEAKHPEVLVLRGYTLKELRQYDGKAGPTAPIYMCVNTRIFDVSKKRNFYGPGMCRSFFSSSSPFHSDFASPFRRILFSFCPKLGGAYGTFGGRDASRGLAKHSFDPSMVSDDYDDLKDLTSAEWEEMLGWQERFEGQYPIVGWLEVDGVAVVSSH